MSDAQPPGDPTQPGPPPSNPPPYGQPQVPGSPLDYTQGHAAPDTIQFGSDPGQGAYPTQPGYPQGTPPQAGYPQGPAPGYPTQPGYPQGYPPFADAPRKKSRTPILIAVAVVVSLVLGGAGIAGAWVWYGWGGTQAEEVLPGTSTVFARVDLSPGLGQKLKIDNLSKKFPRDEETTQDFVEKLERDLLKNLGLEDLTYDTDIKPWFGERIGVAVWSHQKGEDPCGLIALASKDDAKATTALTKARTAKSDDDFGFAFNNGYAVIAECSDGSQAAAEAAVAEAKRQSLSGSGEFAKEVDELPGGQTVLAWVDLDGLIEQAGGVGGLFGGGPSNELDALNDQLKGHVIVGAQATGNGVDLRFRFDNGVKAPSGINDVTKDLDALPGNSVIAAAIQPNASGEAIDQLEKSLDLEKELGPDARRVTDGLRALLGSVITLSVTDLTEDDPALQLIARAANADSAAKLSDLVDLFEEEAGSELPGSLKVDNAGDSVKVTLGDFNGSGKLSDNSLYKETMSGADGTSVAAIFVDVQKVADAAGVADKEARYVRPIKAVGLTAGYDGDTSVGLLRIVVR